MVWISLRSCWRAASRVLLDVELEVEVDKLVAVVDDVVLVVLDVLETAALVLAAWWA
jgi:hypothetical protein